jgi:hypothetical protein
MATDSVVTGAFRLAFPQVFDAKASVAGGAEKFSITMLFAKDGSSLMPALGGGGLMELRKLAVGAIKEKWGEDKAKWPSNLKSLDFKTAISATGKDGWPLRDGDEVAWDGFEDTVFVRAASQFQPGVVDAKLRPILKPSDVFGGLICRAQVNCYAYDNSGNRGVTFGLNNLQVLKDDGTKFGGREAPDKVFGVIEEAGAVGGKDEEPWD